MNNIFYIKLVYTLFLSFFFLGLEKWKPFLNHQKKSSVINLTLAMISFLVTSSAYYFLQIGFSFLNFQRSSFSYIDLIQTVLTLDLVSYFWHRSNHQWNFLWRWHRIHHTDLALEWSSAFRFHFIETSGGLILKITVASLFQCSMSSVFVFEMLFLFCNIFQHSNFAVPGFLDECVRWVFVTQSLHRRHHLTDQENQNTNFSTIFSFWDRIFLTFKSQKYQKPIVYGLDAKQQEFSLKKLLTSSF